MSSLRLGAATLNLTPFDWESNRQCIAHALQAARQSGVGILCLPELAITGYGCEDMFHAGGVQQTALQMLQLLLPETGDLVAALGLPLAYNGRLYNAVAVACDRRLLGFVCKQHLAGDGIHYEPRWFSAWPAGDVATCEFDGRSYPLGDLIFDCEEACIGFEICRDAWVPDRPAGRLAARGATVLLNPSASHFAFAKQEIRKQFVREAARDFGVSFAYANLLGNESGRAIYDGGTLLATDGRLVASGPRFSFADIVLTTIRIARRSPTTARRSATSAASHGLVHCPFRFPATDDSQATTHQAFTIGDGKLQSAQLPTGHPDWENSPARKQEEFSRAVALALWDYLRKSRSQAMVVSLSGGADSSAVATLVFLMARLAEAELSHAQILEKLPALTDFAQAPAPDARNLVRELLTCVYQATRNSSETTRHAAAAVAASVGAEFFEWSVDENVENYVATVSTAIGRELTWEANDLALQNIQARARGPGVWLLANLRNALLLTTSNRSEAAVGYATMDGDTCGGLAPIAGIDKAFLREWLGWLETDGLAGIGPCPWLSVVNAQQPTAELRPPAERQTDEADLMPYRVLDAIERAAIRDKQMPLEVLRTMEPLFPESTRGQLATWIERFFRLWCRNQWKRERYAPSFHLDDENLDPKTWCRFPILSGGFQRELAELRDTLSE